MLETRRDTPPAQIVREEREIVLIGRFWRWSPADLHACQRLQQMGYRPAVAIWRTPECSQEWLEATRATLAATGLFSSVLVVSEGDDFDRLFRGKRLFAFDFPLPNSLTGTAELEGVEAVLLGPQVWIPTGRKVSAFADELTSAWHGGSEASWRPNNEDFELVLFELHRTHFDLWHYEDEARRRDVPDAVIAETKRRIDRLNQQRNNLIERLDEIFSRILEEQGIRGLPDFPAESIGSLVDRLLIWSLKIYHMDEQAHRQDVSEEHRQTARKRLEILRTQRCHLENAYDALRQDLLLGRKSLVVYRQFKLYNDPSTNPALYGKERKG